MKKRKLLVATTNQGKMKEIQFFLSDSSFQLISLKDLKKKIAPPEEDQPTLEGNAIKKAKYYAEKYGLMTLADDSGLFIEALAGWPGVKSARIAEGDEVKCDTVLKKMEDLPEKKRKAVFKNVLAVYNPSDGGCFLAYGEAKGIILKKSVGKKDLGFGYDPIFYIPEKNKTYAEMDIVEKNAISHRGKALVRIKYFLQNEYGGQHILVPIAYIVKNGKILMTRRNDPHRPEWHKKWETPGGIVEMGETIKETLVREAREEAGYDIEIVSSLDTINAHEYRGKNYHYQLYLIPYVCKIMGGKGKFNKNEVLETGWYKPEDILRLDLINTDGKMYKKLLPKLKEIIKKNNL